MKTRLQNTREHRTPASRQPRRPARAGANVIPYGMGLANVGLALLLIADLGSLGGLLNHGLLLIGERNEGLRVAIGDPAGNGGNFMGILLGLELGMGYLVFPLQFIAGRTPVAVSAYRVLCRAILFGHLPLVALLGLDFAHDAKRAFFFTFLTAPVSVLGTPFLYPLWSVLRLRWLDLAAPPQTWEPMAAIDGAVKRAGPPPEPTALWLAILLPFVAAVRARRPGLAVLALLLWIGSWLMLFMAPVRAIVPFALAAGLGRHAAASVPSLPAAPIGRPLDDAERTRRLREIFVPGRLTPPPRFQAGGLLALPPLFVLSTLALVTGVGITGADTLDELGGVLEEAGYALLVIVPFVVFPVQSLAPIGHWLGRLLYRCLGALVTLAHLGATVWFLAISLHLQTAATRPPVQVMAEPMLWPLTLVLIASVPLVLVLALSLPGRPVNLLTIYDRT